MKPVLLLIPGMFNTTAVWDPVRTHLGDDVDVRVADVLTQSSIGAMADDAWARVADLPSATPLVVAGFSMGGYVAIELLARHGARVQALGLVDTSAQVETEASRLNRDKSIAALERNFERTVAGIIAFSLHPQHHARTDLVEGMRAMMHAVGAEAAIRQIRAIVARADHRAMLAQLAIPTCIVCGREDKVTPPAASEDLAALIPGARLTWLESSGHQSPLEQPAELAQALLALVASVRPTTNHDKETP
ncbi:MAG: alpha/beta fold hydrolase [Rhodoferax sp.]|nr:alpha/beta fold hydrolase [Rhodoferax sp.]MCW5627457.1 alpha/beta fold hydrolase [Rhodoferax sp.]